jgi:ferredoxin
MKVSVDADRCMGHGMCARLVPAVFSVNEDSGFNEMGDFELDHARRAEALRGAAACPEHAIKVLEAETTRS